MAVTAAIKFTQGATTDVAGRALFGTLVGGAVVCSNGDNTNVVLWTWTVIDVPPGSAVPLGVQATGNTPTFTFTPDKSGGYHIQLTVQDRAGNVATVDSVFGIKEATNRFISPFGAAANALNFGGQTRGWSPYMEDYLHAIDNASSGWATAITKNFEGAADPGLSANGTYTLAGISGVKRENAANDRVAMAVTADGITIQPAISSYSNSVRTAPLLWFPFSSLGLPSKLDWTSSIRLFARIKLSSQAFDNGHGLILGIDTDSIDFAQWVRQGTNGGASRLFSAGVQASVGSLQQTGGTGGQSTGVVIVCAEIETILKPFGEVLALYKDADVPWPDPATLSPVVGVNAAMSPFTAVNPANLSVLNRLGVVLAADSPNSSNDHYLVSVSDLRVDYRL